eukprot:4343725-Amphidinium_carterae.2
MADLCDSCIGSVPAASTALKVTVVGWTFLSEAGTQQVAQGNFCHKEARPKLKLRLLSAKSRRIRLYTAVSTIINMRTERCERLRTTI